MSLKAGIVPSAAQLVLGCRDMMKWILSYVGPEELYALSKTSKAWNETIRQSFPPSLVHLLNCKTFTVLQKSGEDSRTIHSEYTLGESREQPLPFWGPRARRSGADHDRYFHYWSMMALKTAPIDVHGPLVAIGQSFAHPNRFSKSAGVRIHDLRTGTYAPVPHLNNGYEHVRFHEGVLHMDNTNSFSSTKQNQRGEWVLGKQHFFPEAETCCVMRGERALMLDKSTQTFTIYASDGSSLLKVTDQEIDVGAGTPLKIYYHCVHNFDFDTSHVVVPLTNKRLRIYELRSAAGGIQCNQKTTTNPFDLNFQFVRLIGSKIIVVFSNCQACAIHLPTGEVDKEFLPLDWNGLADQHHVIDYMRRPGKNRVAFALNTGSIQVFDLNKGRITPHTLSSPPGFSRITALEFRENFLALARIYQKDNNEDKWRVELWNWRTGCCMQKWELHAPVYKIALAISEKYAHLALSFSGGEVSVISPQATPHSNWSQFWTASTSYISWIFNGICSCFQWLIDAIRNLIS